MLDYVFALAIASIMTFLITSGDMIELALALIIFGIWKISVGKNYKIGFTKKELFLDLRDFGWSALLIVIFVILGKF